MTQVNTQELTDEQVLELATQVRLSGDFPYFAEKILKVQTTQGTIKPFTLNSCQLILHDIVENHIKPYRPVRIIGLKSRRMGFSTYFSGRYYWKTSRNANRYTAQITHEPEATDALFKMVKRFYDFSPQQYKPETKYNNTSLLEFNTRAGTGLNSGFRVATAGKLDFGSGQLLHYCHLSEVSKWPRESTNSLLTSIQQCVPDNDPDTEVCFESTAKGIGGVFYSRFWGARYRIWVKKLDKSGKPVIATTINEKAPEEDLYTSVFLPWFVFDEYRTKVPLGFVCTKAEERIKRQYGVDDEQIYWRRLTIANKCDGSMETFNQEYPDCPESAFLGTGNPVFDNVKLMAWKMVSQPPQARYECLLSNQQWLTKADGRLKVWEEPKVGRHYIISADVAEGLKEGDFSSADVIDHRTGKQVAHFHGKIDPDEYGILLLALGKRYNTAWIVPERNNHGLMVVTVLVNEGYPKVYCEMVPEPPGKPRKRFGWLTSSATKPMIIDNMIKEVREGSHGIQCAETLEEMMSFKRQDNGKMEADSGMHDDRVMSYAIGKHVRQMLDLPSTKINTDKKGRKMGDKRRRPGSGGWT